MSILTSDMARARADVLPRRRRSARAMANDEALRQSTIALTASEGWDAVSFTRIARDAGLTVGAVYSRAENKAELGTDIWSAVVGPRLRSAMCTLVCDRGNAAAAIKDWTRAPDDLRAAVELLIAAMFDDDLAEVVSADMSSMLNEYMGADVTPEVAAARAIAVAVAIGRLLCATNSLRNSESNATTALWIQTLFTGSSDTRAPATTTATEDRFEFLLPQQSDDPHRDLLELAALEALGRVGYRRATVARICRLSQLSSGSMFVRFQSKDDLIRSAYTHHVRSADSRLSHLAARRAQYGDAAAMAMMFKDFLSPSNDTQRYLMLEVQRVRAHNPALQSIEVIRDRDSQAMLGLGLLSHYRPTLRTLPFAAALSVGTP